ncbi:hypothetical protein [Sphingobium sp.]|uniref:hypothetical protein n=1 Tax=Sphingobium sp. TaxID=1912891 RepID=UPI002BBC6E90|nr:hypothetical protein [Sphingobium sp.]HUD93869.1 hypothetical protein [Sphingobium sp.]
MKQHLTVAVGLHLALAMPASAQQLSDQVVRIGETSIRTTYVSDATARDVIASPGETVELVFSDGTSVTLAAGASLRIENYLWQDKAGRLAMTFQSGVARLAAGETAASNDLHIVAGQAEVRLGKGDAILVDLRPQTAGIVLLVGHTAEISINGDRSRIERPGYAMMLGGDDPGSIRRYATTSLRTAMETLNPGMASTGGGSAATMTNAPLEGDARDLRQGTELARLELGPAASRIASGSINGGLPPATEILGEPIFDPDLPTINNASILRGPATQTIFQDPAFSPARGLACTSGGVATACSQSQANIFTTFQRTAGEQQRAAGASVSLVMAKGGAVGPAILQGLSGNGTPLSGAVPNSVYAFSLDDFKQPFTDSDGNIFDVTVERLVPMLAIFDSKQERLDDDFGRTVSGSSDINDDDGNPLGNASVQSKQASVADFGSDGSFKFRIDSFMSAQQSRLGFTSQDDGVLFSYLVEKSLPTDNTRDIFQSTPFGSASVSLVQAGFRGYRGVTDATTPVTQSGPLAAVEFLLIDRLPENFLAVQIDEIASGPITSDCALTACNGYEYFFAAGDVAARPAQDRASVDTFFLTPGLTGFGEADGPVQFRAFFPGTPSSGMLGREDATAYVVTPASGDTAKVAHADFTYNLDAGRITGLSIGAAIGDLTYTDYYDADGRPTAAGSGTREAGRRQFAGTIGRTLGAVDGNGGNASIYHATWDVLASGGGNPNLRQVDPNDRASNTQSQGRAGYILFNAQAPGGDEGLLRLAQGIGTQGVAELDRTGGRFNGYLAGVVQIGNSGELAWLDGIDSGNLTLEIANDMVAATLSPRTVVNAPAGSFTFGGADNGAFISRDRFLAFSPEDTAIDGVLISSGFLAPFQGNDDPLGTFDAAVPEYARWGAFLGDLAAGSGSGQIASFAPWVAAPIVEAAALPARGQAIYSGSALGDVAVQDAGRTTTYLAGGSFTHDWSFANRRGTFDMRFDSRDYTALTGAAPTGFAFSGALRNSGTTSQIGAVSGSFITPSDAAAGAIPQGTIGQFTINQSGGYIAGGVFAGGRSQ